MSPDTQRDAVQWMQPVTNEVYTSSVPDALNTNISFLSKVVSLTSQKFSPSEFLTSFRLFHSTAFPLQTMPPESTIAFNPCVEIDLNYCVGTMSLITREEKSAGENDDMKDTGSTDNN